MSEVQRVTLGVLPKHSVPDPIMFIFNDAEGQPRPLDGPDWSFTVVIKKGELGEPEAVVDQARMDTAEAAQGKIRYQWRETDLDVPDAIKIQMIATKTEGGDVIRRHISDIAVINAASSPASTTLIPE
jgi:hypothetical protein